MKKVYLVVRDHGYNEIDTIAAMSDKAKAKEYARLLGSEGDVQKLELLDEIPEHWTVWTSRMELYTDGRQQNSEVYTSEWTNWEDDNFDPMCYPSIKVLQRYTHDYSKQDPWTLEALYEARQAIYREAFIPQPEREPNTWSITIESLDKDEAERLAREHYDALKAKWING